MALQAARHDISAAQMKRLYKQSLELNFSEFCL